MCRSHNEQKKGESVQETDLDALLEGDASQGNSQTSQEQSDTQSKAANAAQEEFNKLSGTAQDRFQKLIRRARTAEEDLERYKALALQGTKLPPPPPVTGQNQDILAQLEAAGVMTDRKYQQMASERDAQREYQSRLRQLSQQESGDDGRPKFDQYEYEDFVRQNPQYKYYDPADVYSIMYRDELIDWEMKHRSSGSQTQTLKNTKTFSGDDVWSPEYINEKLGSFEDPNERISWYEKNREKIEKVLSQ